MNLTLIAVATIGIAELLLLISRVRRLILRRTEQRLEADLRLLSLHLTPSLSTEKRKRGRPPKTETPTVRHLFLPPHITSKQLNGLATFFLPYQDPKGDTIVLCVPTFNGPERTIEVPYPVHYDEQLKEKFNTSLGGWA